MTTEIVIDATAEDAATILTAISQDGAILLRLQKMNEQQALWAPLANKFLTGNHPLTLVISHSDLASLSDESWAQLCQIVEKYPAELVLDLTEDNLSAMPLARWQALQKAQSARTAAFTLNLSKNNLVALAEDAWGVVHQMMVKSSQELVLDLADNGLARLDDQRFSLLCEGMAACPTPLTMNLARNQLGESPERLVQFSPALSARKSSRMVDLSENQVDETAWQAAGLPALNGSRNVLLHLDPPASPDASLVSSPPSSPPRSALPQPSWKMNDQLLSRLRELEAALNVFPSHLNGKAQDFYKAVNRCLNEASNSARYAEALWTLKKSKDYRELFAYQGPGKWLAYIFSRIVAFFKPEAPQKEEESFAGRMKHARQVLKCGDNKATFFGKRAYRELYALRQALRKEEAPASVLSA